MSGPVPSPSMYGMIGSSGTTMRLFSKPMRVPEVGCGIRSAIGAGLYPERSEGSTEQSPERGQILPIADRLDRLRSLDHLRDPREPGIIEKQPECIQTDFSFADVLMAVDAGAKRLLRVVEMKGTDALDSGEALDLVDRPLVPVAR